MRHLALALALALVITGCSAAKSALGVLSPKPQPISVVTHVEAPAVTVTSAPGARVLATEAPRRRGVLEQVGIVTVSTAAGALLGGVIGRVAGERTRPAAVVGGAVGAAAGAVMTRL